MGPRSQPGVRLGPGLGRTTELDSWGVNRLPSSALLLVEAAHREVDVRREAEAEFDWWYRTAYPRVARAIFLIVHDRGIAQDIAQDAFVEMLRHWSTVSGYEQPDAWVRRVAIRMAIRRVRREHRRPGLELLASTPSTAVEGMGRSEVVTAIATLSPMQRAAVVLYYWADQPVQRSREPWRCRSRR